MLVQKRKTSSKMIFLWLSIAIVVLIAGFIVYQNFYLSTPTTPSQTNTSTLSKQLPVPKEFGQSIFTDPRFNNLTDEGTPSLGYTNQIGVTVTSSNEVPPPTQVKVFNPAYGGKLLISWDPSAGSVTGYDIYRSSSLSVGYALVGQVGPDITDFADSRVENGKEYFYRVKASQFVESNRTSVAVDASTDEATVQTIASGGTILDWKNSESNFEAITIVRNSGNKSQPLRTFMSSNGGDAPYFMPSASYQDPDGTMSDAYTIIWYSSYKESTFSPSQSGTPTDATPPDSPDDVEIVNMGDGQSILIRWTNPLDSDFDYVKIRRSLVQGDAGSIVKSERTLYEQEGEACQCSIVLKEGQSCSETVTDGNPQSPEGNCFIDQGSLRKGEKYYYTVTALDLSGNESISRIIGPKGRDNPFSSTSP